MSFLLNVPWSWKYYPISLNVTLRYLSLPQMHPSGHNHYDKTLFMDTTAFWLLRKKKTNKPDTRVFSWVDLFQDRGVLESIFCSRAMHESTSEASGSCEPAKFLWCTTTSIPSEPCCLVSAACYLGNVITLGKWLKSWNRLKKCIHVRIRLGQNEWFYLAVCPDGCYERAMKKYIEIHATTHKNT